MQKNKSFQKVSKLAKQSHHTSSKVLLELSQITTHSREKSSKNQNYSDRPAIHHPINIENTTNEHSAKKLKENLKIQQKKQSYVKKNISLSNTVLKQIMQMSGSLPMNGKGATSMRSKQGDNDLMILAKREVQKSKMNSQANNSRKLLLYENKQNQQKPISKPKPSYGQAFKGEAVTCSFKIHPVDDQKVGATSHVSSNTQRRDSLDARRNSFSGRRSSITLIPQDDLSTESKIRQIRKSFLTKFSGEDNNNNATQHPAIINSQSFLKKAQQNFIQSRIDEKKLAIQRQTCTNDTEISPHQKKQTREKYLFKLDELNVIEQDIKKDALKFIPSWDALLQSQRNIKKAQQYFTETRSRYESIQSKQNQLKSELFDENKRYIIKKRMSSTSENVQKQTILLEVEKNHTETKKKVFKKDLQDMMIFNMRVVLPSSEMTESTVSCFNNHSNSTLSLSNMTVLQLYEELINQRACKKYGMILKKQINNMNIYDSRTMHEYLRKLYELQLSFHRVQTEDPEIQFAYLDRIESLVGKIDGISKDLQSVKQKYSDLSRRIKENERIKQAARTEIDSLLEEMSQSIFSDYKLFQTGGRLQTPTKANVQDHQISENFCQNNKTVQQFKDLVTKKYKYLYERYRQVSEQKAVIQHLLRSRE